MSARPAPIHEVGSVDNYGGIKVKIISDTGRILVMEVLASKDGYTAGEVITRHYNTDTEGESE